MNHTDFFQEYQNKKKASEELFKGLQSKFVLNEGEIDEAFLGIKSAKDREKELEIDFFKHIDSPAWGAYNLDLGGGKFVEASKATDAEKKQAWTEFAKNAQSYKFKGGVGNYKGVVKYDPQGGSKSNTTTQTQGTGSSATQTQGTGSSATQPTNYKLFPSKKYKGALAFGSEDRVVSKITMPSNAVYENHDWAGGPLKFLFEPPLKFMGTSIAFDLKRNVILNFNGTWIGTFVGNTFVGEYNGNSFKGDFSSKNEGWKAQPTAFVSGTFYDTTKTGILGLDNIEEASENDTFNLIQIPAGFSIEVLTSKQLRHTITITKRLDNVDSNFVFSVYMGYEIDSTTPDVVTLPWEQIRQDFNSYQVSSKTTSLPDLFSLQSGEQIIELRVLKAGTPPVFKKKEKFDATKQYSENPTSLVDGFKTLGSTIPAFIRNGFNFKINNDKDFNNFTKTKGYFNSPQFTQDLDAASTFLDNNRIKKSEIDANYPYLSNLFADANLSEVNLTGRGGSGRRLRTFGGGTSLPVMPGTNKKINSPADIAIYLADKYKDDLKIGKTDRYNKEHRTLTDLLKVSKATGTDGGGNTSVQTTIQSQTKETDAVLRRLENFVKYFVNTIDAGKNTQAAKEFILDAIKDKLDIKAQPVQSIQPNTTSTASTVGLAAKQQALSGGHITTESVIRLKIRDILKQLL